MRWLLPWTGTPVAAPGTQSVIRLWNVESGQERTSICGHIGPILTAVFSPDGSLLASARQDRIIRLHPSKPSAVAKAPVPPAPSMGPDASSQLKAVLPPPKVSNPTAMPQGEQGTP